MIYRILIISENEVEIKIDRNATGNKQPCRCNVKGVIAWGKSKLKFKLQQPYYYERQTNLHSKSVTNAKLASH